MKIFEASALGSERYGLGEGPCYDPVTGMISWVDITANTLWTMHKNGVREPFVFDQPIGAAVPVKDRSGFILAAKHGLYLYEDGQIRLIKDLKETYLATMLSAEAEHTKAVERYVRYVARCAREKNWNDVQAVPSYVSKMWHRAAFYRRFDTMFLHLYPRFVDEVNGLLSEPLD